MLVQENRSLRDLNTFGVEAKARYRVVLERPEEIDTLRCDPRWRDLPRLVLGGGSNVLFVEDFPGIVIQVGWAGWSIQDADAEATWIRAGAGHGWHALVRETIDAGLAGLENLSLIPGTVGAAPIQNIGAYGVELKGCFGELDAIDLRSGELRTFSHADCAFGYRDSVLKHTEPDRWLITSVVFRLPSRPTWQIDYAGLREQLARAGHPPLSARIISDAVCALRRAKLPDPREVGNAGSFFKNPVVSAEFAGALQEHFPSLPVFPAEAGQAKLSAAWLIEQCGWKGFREGDAGVSPRHALVLVNYGRASGAALWRLAEAIQQSVGERFGVQLDPEPRRIG